MNLVRSCLSCLTAGSFLTCCFAVVVVVLFDDELRDGLAYLSAFRDTETKNARFYKAQTEETQ